MSGIAIALAALQPANPAVPFFLLVGLLASVGAGYALGALWEDSGLRPRHLLPRHRPEWLDGRYEALVYLTWALIALVVTYVVFFFALYQEGTG